MSFSREFAVLNVAFLLRSGSRRTAEERCPTTHALIREWGGDGNVSTTLGPSLPHEAQLPASHKHSVLSSAPHSTSGPDLVFQRSLHEVGCPD